MQGCGSRFLFRAWIFASALLLVACHKDAVYKASIEPIPIDIADEMHGHSWREHCPVQINNLRLVKLRYWGYDGWVRDGSIIINKTLAPDLVKIFAVLFKHHFQFKTITPSFQIQDDYARFLLANSTMGFHCRFMVGRNNKFSLHSYGRAIDINPRQNPYQRKSLVIPPGSEKFLDRKQISKGMIAAQGIVVKTFKKYGWRWGGDWRTRKDYMHFQK